MLTFSVDLLHLNQLKTPVLSSDTAGFRFMETKSNEKRVAVYIDGSNFYHKLKDLSIPNTTKFGYEKLCSWLARDRRIISSRYYVGVVRAKENDEKGQRLRSSQQQLFSHLTKEGLTIKRGYLVSADGAYHEKGVDVQIAVDMLIGAYENLYDTAILISSDTDLIPAIKKIKYMGKGIEYIGFAHKPSFGLQKYATLSRLLIKEELEPFVFNSLV